MTVRWTIMGKVMAAIGLLLYGAALTSQSGFLLLLIGIILACFIINYVQSSRMVKSVQVNCPAGVQVCEGDKLRQPWKLLNELDRPVGLMSLESAAGRLFDVAGIGPGETHTVLPDLTFNTRGVYPYEACFLQSTFPFGLLTASRKPALKGEVVVFPRIYVTPAPVARGYDVMVGGKFKGQRKSTSGAHFAGVRPFHDGDPLRQIHWKSSAKGQGLMVKVFDEELSGRIGMLLDPGVAGDEENLNRLARAAGSLIFAAQDEGHHVELGDVVSDHVRMVPPFADGQEILDYLARLVPRKTEVDLAEKFTVIVERMSPRASICLLLTRWRESIGALFTHLSAHKRTVSVYLPDDVAVPNLPGLKVYQYSAHTIRSL